MIELEMSDVARETIDIINYFNPKFIEKISSTFLNGLNEIAKNSEKITQIDKTKKLKDQNISEESKDLISLIYYNYIATEEEKRKLAKIWNENEIAYQKELSQKYSVDNLFKSNEKVKVEVQENTNLPDIIRKESIIEKIKKFFKKMFHKN